jgi:hypothetical protein
MFPFAAAASQLVLSSRHSLQGEPPPLILLQAPPEADKKEYI